MESHADEHDVGIPGPACGDWEIAMTMQLGNRSLKDATKLIGLDAFKALAGLIISVILALAGSYYAA